MTDEKRNILILSGRRTWTGSGGTAIYELSKTVYVNGNMKIFIIFAVR